MYGIGNNGSQLYGLNQYVLDDEVREELGLLRRIAAPPPPNVDATTILVDIQVTGNDVGPYADSQTILVDIQVSGVDVLGHQYTDSATVYYDIAIATHDCLIPWAPVWYGASISHKWTASIPYLSKWSASADNKWTGTENYETEEIC